MAEEYLAELRVRQPHGPYYLSGYCGGGIVAYEMAQHLHAVGETVALLVIIDLFLRPEGFRFIFLARRRVEVRAQARDRTAALVLSGRAQRSTATWAHLTVRNTLEDAVSRRPGRHPHADLIQRDFGCTGNFCRRRVDRYTAEARLHGEGDGVSCARAQSPLRGPEDPRSDGRRSFAARSRCTRSPATIKTLTGTLEPNVQVLAAQLDACLRAAESAHPVADRAVAPSADGPASSRARP